MAKIIPKGYRWAICISHDVDHLKHYWNLNLLKFFGVSFIELIREKRTFNDFAKVLVNSVFTKNDSWNQAEILATVDKTNKIPATFFFALRKGLGVDYEKTEVKKAVKKLSGFDIGVHGQAFQDFNLIKEEFQKLKIITGKKPLGIRIHYLRKTEQIFDLLKKTGYAYDSTEFSENLKQPYKMENGLVEIPVHIMDTYLFSPFYKDFALGEAKKYTQRLIEKARKEKKVLNVIFHLRHVSAEFPRQREYYLWLLDLIGKDKKCYKISLGGIAKKVGK